MGDLSDTVELLDKLIREREEHFQHALSESAEQSLITHLKNDIDFLKEKRQDMLFEMHPEKAKNFN